MVSTQRDQLARHIHIYRGKVNTCQSEYDVSRFHSMISRLKKQLQAAGNADMTNVGALRSAVARLGQEGDASTKHATTAKSWNTSTRVVKQQPAAGTGEYDRKAQEEMEEYFRWYIRFLDYLQQLVQSFHIEVFLPLCSCMSALVTHSPTSTPSRSNQGSRLSHASLSSRTSITSRRLIQPQLSRELHLPAELQGEVGELLNLIQSPKGSQTQEHIGNLLQQLNVLLDNDSIISHSLNSSKTTSINSKESKMPGMTSDVQALERLLPTVFEKFHECLRLSEEWMEWDQEQMKQLYMRRPKLNQLQHVLAHHKVNVQDEIAATEKDIDDKYDNVHRLSLREDRSNVLTVKVFSLQSQLSESESHLAALELEKVHLIDKMSNAAKQRLGRQVADDIRYEYAQNQLARMLTRREIESSKYVLELVQEDLQLETELKPSFVRFTNDAHEQCEHLEERLEEKRELKDMLDSVLKPLSNHRYEADTGDTSQQPAQSPRNSSLLPDINTQKLPNKVVRENGIQKMTSNKQQESEHNTNVRTQGENDNKSVAYNDAYASQHVNLSTEIRVDAANNSSQASTSRAPKSILKVKPLLQTVPTDNSEKSADKPTVHPKQHIVNNVTENKTRNSSNIMELRPTVGLSRAEAPKSQPRQNTDNSDQEQQAKVASKDERQYNQGHSKSNKGFLIPVYEPTDNNIGKRAVDNKTKKAVRTRDT